MGLEATSWNWLRSGIQRQRPRAILERVENGVLAGMADVNYVIDGVEGWIELKAVGLPKRASTAVLGADGLRDPDQINWHLRRAQEGSKTFIFVTAGDYRWLVAGGHAKAINEFTIFQLCSKSEYYVFGKWSERSWARLIEKLSAYEI